MHGSRKSSDITIIDDEFVDATNILGRAGSTEESTDRTTNERQSAEGEDDSSFYDAESHLPSASNSYPAHSSAFEGKAEELMQQLRQLPRERWKDLDPQGNTLLHVAVLRRRRACVAALIEVNFPLTAENSRGWMAVEDAVALNDREMVKLLYIAMLASMKRAVREKKVDLVREMAAMPDYQLQLQWELGSSIFGFLLRKYAPHDTYKVYKKGTRLRVDGSLMGVEDEQSSMIPKWKRGHFSILFDGATQPSAVYLVNWAGRSFVDVQKEKKKAQSDPDAEVRSMMSEGAKKSAIKSSEFRFKPVRGWLGSDLTEKVGGWKARVFEASGKLKAVTTEKALFEIPADATFEEYVDLPSPKDTVSELMIDPLSMQGMGGSSKQAKLEEDSSSIPDGLLLPEVLGTSEAKASMKEAQREAKKGKGGRKITARCWMAEDFPMSLKQLVPVLDVVGYANKHVARASKFLQKYGQMDLFPVKLQVPLLMTVHLLMISKEFSLLKPGSEATKDSFYELPNGFQQKSFKGLGFGGSAIGEDVALL